MARIQVGQKARIKASNDNENYTEYRGKTLIITHVARSTKGHPGYDPGIGEALMDFETESGESVPFSLYEYEVNILY